MPITALRTCLFALVFVESSLLGWSFFKSVGFLVACVPYLQGVITAGETTNCREPYEEGSFADLRRTAMHGSYGGSAGVVKILSRKSRKLNFMRMICVEPLFRLVRACRYFLQGICHVRMVGVSVFPDVDGLRRPLVDHIFHQGLARPLIRKKPWRERPVIRVVGQLDFTTVSKRTSLKSVHIFDTTCLSINHPSFAWPSRSLELLAANSPPAMKGI